MEPAKHAVIPKPNTRTRVLEFTGCLAEMFNLHDTSSLQDELTAAPAVPRSGDVTTVSAAALWKEFSAIIDSGRSTHLTSIRSDFYHLATEPTIKIKAVDGVLNDGRPVGYAGKLKQNNLWAKDAIFMPGMKVERLISTQNLIKDGWVVELCTGRRQGLFTQSEDQSEFVPTGNYQETTLKYSTREHSRKR